MATRLVLEPGGVLRLYKYDADLKSACRVERKYDKYIVKREGRTVFMANSKEETESYFWPEKEIEFIWTKLREPVEVKKGVTLGDVYNMILSRPDLRALVSMWWPSYRSTTPLEEPDTDRLILSRQGVIDKTGKLLIVNELEVEPALALSDMPLEVNESFIVKKRIVNKKNPDITTKQILEGKNPFTLLDLLCGLFNNYVFYGPATLTKAGLHDEDGSLVDDPLPFLLAETKVKNLTLGDLFNWVSNNETLKTFVSMYSWCRDIDGFHAAARQKPKHKSELSYLECYKSVWCSGEFCSVETGFHGVDSDKTCYGVDFSPMASLAHLPLRLDDKLQLETKEGVIECRHPFTLLEILDSVYWEISYYGGVKDTADLIEERSKAIEEIAKDFI